MSEGTKCDRSLDGLFESFFTGVALTALVLVLGRGTGIAMAAACGGSSSGAAWKYASAIARKPIGLSDPSVLPVIVREIRVPIEEKQMR